MSPDIIGTATISGAKLFLMKDLKLIYIFQDKLIIKFYFKVTKRNANLPFLSVNFPSVCSEITSQIVCKFLQIIVGQLLHKSGHFDSDVNTTVAVFILDCLLGAFTFLGHGVHTIICKNLHTICEVISLQTDGKFTDRKGRLAFLFVTLK